MTSLRNLYKNKLYTIVNLLGLTIGLSCVMLISLWILEQYSFDNFHPNGDRIYRVLENQYYSDGFVLTTSATPGQLAASLKTNWPEIALSSRVTWGDEKLFKVDNKVFKEKGYHADPDFLRIFNFPVIAGEGADALEEPGKILITTKMAEKYFGHTDVVGQMIRVDNEREVQIAGVMADVPDNTSFKFDFLLPLKDYEKNNDWLKNWNSNGIRTFLMTTPQSPNLNEIPDLKEYLKTVSDQDNADLLFQGLADMYLRYDYKDGKYQGGGRITYIRLFAIIALFIILIACINFMNLSTARASTRTKEVGIRRVSGATRGMLIRQFLGESLLLSIFAGVFAVVLVQLSLPAFNELFDAHIYLDFSKVGVWSLLLGITLLAGFLAGSYPAFFLSRFQPIEIFNKLGKQGKGANWFRKGLVVTQFAIATFLIVGTMVIYLQMNHIRHQNLGFQKENFIYMPVNGTLWDKYDLVKTELTNLPGVQSVSASNGLIYQWGNNTSSVSWPGKDPEASILFQTIPVELDFMETIGADLVDGRDFSAAFPADSTNFIVNERAAEMMGLQQAVGERITVQGDEGQIIGMVKNFRTNSLHVEQEPVILMHRPWKNFIFARLNTDDTQQTLGQIEKILATHNPAYPFEFSFVDKEYEKLYRTEARVGTLSRLFAILSIFISCLGLFGLATFTAQQRTKEIGIRKVMGASISQLSTLLSGEFLKLVIVGFVIAAPVAWLVMHDWLERFVSHIELSWWIFIMAAVLSISIALLTISLQTIRAASINPVKALRYE